MYKILLYILIIAAGLISCQYNTLLVNLGQADILYVDKDITVDSGKILEIAAGTEYVFTDTFKIIVKGGLLVAGQVDKPVIFRPQDSLKGWGGIIFDNPSDSCHLRFAILNNGRIHGENVNLQILGCRFTNNLMLDVFDAVVRVFYGSLLVKNCWVVGNNTGEGFLVHYIVDSPAIVEGCVFKGVSDAIEFLGVKRMGRIIDNEISDISLPTGDGIDFNGCDSIYIEGNSFNNIIDYGCEIGNDKYGPSRRIYINNNLFSNCFRGIVVKGGSDVVSDKNIFYNNRVGLKCQYEKWTKITDANSIVATNSLFYGSKEEDFVNNENSTIELINCYSDKNNNVIGMHLSPGNCETFGLDNLKANTTIDSLCMKLYNWRLFQGD